MDRGGLKEIRDRQTVQRPLNSSISAMSLSISGVMLIILISCIINIHFHPFIAESHPISVFTHFHPFGHGTEHPRLPESLELVT